MKKRTIITLDSKTIERLKIIAAKKAVSMNEIIKQAIQQRLAEEEGK